MRTEKQILRKVNEWKHNPMLVSGVYRLFTYIPYASIPEEYHEHFPPEAKDKWDEDLNTYTKAHLYADVEAQMNAFLKIISKKNIIHCIGLIPMMLADVYMTDKSVTKLQIKLIKVIEEFQTLLPIDRPLAERLAVYEMLGIITDIQKLLDLKVAFDMDSVIERILRVIDAESQKTMITPAINDAVEKALEDYKEVEVKDGTEKETNV